MRQLRNAFTLFLLFSFCAAPAFAQHIAPQVQINLDKVSDNLKPLWKGAESKVSEYLTNKWSEDPFGYSVPLSIGIFIDQVVEKQPERTFRSFLLISNGTGAQFSDKRWVFPLPDWNNLRGNSFDPFLSTLEYYVNLVLAAEYDKWDPFGGEIWYTRARGVADQGKFDSRYVLGWQERSDLLHELQASKNRVTRQFNYYAFTGAYLAQTNPSDAKVFVDSAFTLLDKLPSDESKTFFSVNSLLLADAALQLQRRDYLEKLMRVDTTNRALYHQKIDKLPR